MAITRVQTANDVTRGSAVASLAPAFGSNVASGNRIIVVVRSNNRTVDSITDSLGTSYGSADVSTDNTGGGASVGMYFYSGNAPSGGANTVTVTFSGTVDYAYVFIMEYSGLASASVLDTSDTRKSDSFDADMVTNPFSTATAGCLVLVHANSDTGGTLSAGSDFTLVADGIIPDFASAIEEYIPTGTLSSYTAHFTNSNPHRYTMMTAAYKPAGGGGRTTKNTRSSPLGVEVGMGWRMAA